MVESTCQCGTPFAVPESAVGQALACQQCGQTLHFVCAETLDEGTGAGDFDARLVVQSGPQQVGEQFLLGGVPEIVLGKNPDKHIVLPGKLVSRSHCKLVRLDYGPSRWELQDNKSTNGLQLNGQRVEAQELKDGDVVRVGEYELKYVSTFDRDQEAARAAAAAATLAAGGALCPSCGNALPPGAKICVDCGVDVTTGRSLVVSRGFDEQQFESTADAWIRGVSWIMPFGLFPIASEAFGTKKPITTWVIAAITVVASVAFFIPWLTAEDEPGPAVQNLMQWSGHQPSAQEMALQRAELVQELKTYRDRERRKLRRQDREISELSDDDLRQIADSMMAARAELYEDVEFHWYQLFTSAMIHDPGGILPFIYHLGGNMVFFFVFGMRVNELVGNWRFAILYPLLAVGSGLINHLMHMDGTLQAGLGASGAIMGLAGAYFVFFPIQRVHMAIWFRGGLITKWQCLYKIFTMRGFWLLVLWVGYNDILPVALGWSDGVGHWAHLGGFITGVALALMLLLSRQTSAGGTDILSVVLGKHAWALVGKPAARAAA